MKKELMSIMSALMLAFIFFPTKNVFCETDNFNIILSRAENGEAEAQYELGKIYLEGAKVPKDEGKATEWFKKSAEQGFAKSQFHLGVIYLTNQHLLLAKRAAMGKRDANSEQIKEMMGDGLKWLRLAYPNVKRLAESGDPEAQFILSRMFMGMLPEINDKDKAAEWRRTAKKSLEKIAESGNVKAQRNLGGIYAFDSLNNPEMIKWYTKAAKQGDSIAQYELGSHYEFTKEHAKAIEWLTKAAEQGHIEAQYELGEIHDKNQWNSKDAKDMKTFYNDDTAIKWYLKADQSGHHEAQGNLAFIYLKKGDYKRAVQWYTKAAENGHADSQKALFHMYYLGEEVEKDLDKSLKWSKRIAEHAEGSDLIRYQEMAAEIYEEKREYTNAFEWYMKADKNGGSARTSYSLGEMYGKGKGTNKDLRKSAKHFQKAAEAGYDLAQYHLAGMYYKGDGVIQDYIEAYKWANLAAMKLDWCRSLRDKIKKDMTSEQIAEGQKRASEFHHKQEERWQKLLKSINSK